MQSNLSNDSSFESPKMVVKRPVAGLVANVCATLLVCVALGMLAILVPVQLQGMSFSDSTIGGALSFESVASIVICFLLPSFLSKVGMPVGLLLSTILRVPSILIFPYFNDLGILIFAIFIHGIGCYMVLILLQTWVNGIPLKKNKGLIVALYSTSVSVGLALGPVVIATLKGAPELLSALSEPVLSLSTAMVGSEPMVDTAGLYAVATLITLFAAFPLIISLPIIPRVTFNGSSTIFKSINASKGAMFAIMMAGVSQFGVAAFITIYGIKNGLLLEQSALLLTAFMLGSLMLEVPIAWLSDHFDRRYFIVGCAFACMFCAVYLPIAIYTPLNAYILVFLWGGVIAGIYSVSLALVGEKNQKGDAMITANAGYSLMESIGGTLGILCIGFAIEQLGNDGMPYVIMFASIVYFSFALTRYKVE